MKLQHFTMAMALFVSALTTACNDGGNVPEPHLSVNSSTADEPGDESGAATPRTVRPHTVKPNSPSAVSPASLNGVKDKENPQAQRVESGAKSPDHDVLFKDWAEPQAALFITGRQHGYIEPCGCTGLANQKGGLARRHTLQTQLREKGWPLISLDVGNQVRRFGRQADIKFQVTLDAFRTMKYDAVALGPDDLRLSSNDLIAAFADAENRFVSSNAFILDASLTPATKTFTAGGVKVGVTAVLGAAHQAEMRKQIDIANSDILLEPPVEALTKAADALKNENCDVYVLLAQASLGESRKFAKKFPLFDLIVTAGGAGEPTYMPEDIEGTDAVMVQAGTKGMYVGVVGIFADHELRYQRVPLDDRFGDSPKMRQLMAVYQEQLKEIGLKGLGISPLSHPTGHTFVGSHLCGDCHSMAFKVWKKSGHAHATESLVHPGERGDVARHFDPECLSCHVTGWNPQRFYPYKSGYVGLEESMAMHGSGCENCHGPGSAHVAAESGEVELDDAAIERLREQMRMPLAKAERQCMECHDLDNSPDFHEPGAFQKYWQKIEHVGKD